MDMFLGYTGKTTGIEGFAATDNTLYVTQFFNVFLPFGLFFQKGDCFFINSCCLFIGNSKLLIEVGHKTNEPQCFIISHGNIARSLVRHMYFMPLINKSLKGATHGNNIIIRVWTK